MPQFEEFKKKHGPASNCRRVPPDRMTAYQKKLPDSLLAEWKQSGWCAFGDGLIWLIDPEDLKAPIKEWLGAKTKAIPFARSAFAHVFLWDSKGAHLLDPHYGTLAELIDDVDLVFESTFLSARYLDDVLEQKLFRKVFKKLGPLQHDECYGFEPAIALGGTASVENVTKVKLREHLSILSQLVDEIRNV